MSRKRHRGVRTQDHLARVAAELERCMKCGKCRSVCPVFRELQNELFSARGKIKLAEKIAQGEFTLTPRARQAIAECLVCRTCSVNCPSGVHVEEVILGLRWHLTEQKGLGLARRFIFRLLLQWRWPLTLSAKTIAVAQRLFLGSNAKNPLRLLFPLFGLSRRRNLPRFALRSGLGLYPEVVSPRQGGSRWRVGYFVGCAANLIYPEVVRAVVTVLTHHGCQVVIPKKQKCDGMPALVNGDFQGVSDCCAIISSCSSATGWTPLSRPAPPAVWLSSKKANVCFPPAKRFRNSQKKSMTFMNSSTVSSRLIPPIWERCRESSPITILAT